MFNKEPLHPSITKDWKEKLLRTGNILNNKHPGQPRTRTVYQDRLHLTDGTTQVYRDESFHVLSCVQLTCVTLVSLAPWRMDLLPLVFMACKTSGFSSPVLVLGRPSGLILRILTVLKSFSFQPEKTE